MARGADEDSTGRANGAVGFVAYDLEEVRPAADAWRTGVARHLADRGFDVREHDAWDIDHQRLCARPDLLLGQTCGYPLRNALRGRLRVVAAPVYRAPACAGGEYASVVIVRASDDADSLERFRGRVCAFNSRDSHSGYNVLRYHVSRHAEARPFFTRVVETGAHVHSAGAVASGRADVAAIDGVVWALLGKHRPEAIRGLRILCTSARAPALPYVTRAELSGDAVARLREALRAAVADPSLAAARDALLIEGFEPLPDAAYERIDFFESEAAARGYRSLE